MKCNRAVLCMMFLAVHACTGELGPAAITDSMPPVALPSGQDAPSRGPLGTDTSGVPSTAPGPTTPGPDGPTPISSVGSTGGPADNTSSGNGDAGSTVTVPSSNNWTSFGGGNENHFSRADQSFDVSSMQGPGMAWNIPAPGVTGTPAIHDGVAYWWDIGKSNEGTFHATNLADGTSVWERKFMRGSTASAFADERHVYIGDRDTTVRALNRLTGDTVWETQVSDKIHGQLWSSPTVVDGILIIGMASKGTGNGVGATTQRLRDFGGAVIALNAMTGAKIWHFETTLAPDGTRYGPGAPVWSSPAVDPVRKYVYVGTGNSYYAPASKYSDSLIALDYSTTDPKGKLVWSRQFTANDNFASISPTSNGPDYDVGAAPTLFSVGGEDYVGVGDKGGRFYVLTRDLKADANGENTIVWQQELSAGGPTGGVMAPAAFRDGTLYVASNHLQRSTRLYALDAATGKPNWGPVTLPFITYGNIILTKDALLLGSSTGYANNTPPANVLAYRLDSGQAFPWRFPLPQQHGGGMSIANGTLLVGYGFHFLNDAQEPVLGGLIALRMGGVMVTPDPEPMPTAPTRAPTFKAVYEEVLVPQGCSAPGCHSATALQIDDAATAHSMLLGATAMGPACSGQALVVPGDPDQSLLVQKLRPNPPCGGQMPPGMSLAQEDIDQLVMWIQMGAMNN